MAIDVPSLVSFKDYLADRPETAFLALSLMAIVYLHRGWMAARDAHQATLERWLPVAEKLSTMVSTMATKSTRAKKESPPSGSPPVG